MSKPFTVELHLHGGKVVSYTLDEDEIRERGSHGVVGSVIRDTREHDERKRLRTAAYYIVLKMMDPKVGESSEAGARTVSVVDDGGVWVVPLSAIAAVRLIDPETLPEQRPFGFVNQDNGETT